VAERRIDNAIGRNTENKLARVDTGQQTRFGGKAVVGGVVEFKDGVEQLVVVGEAGEHGRAPISKLRGDQAMCVATVDQAGA
jgi:hypothetical protein